MNNTTIINTFNNDNSNIIGINPKHCQIMTTVTDRIQKFKPMIKKPIVLLLGSNPLLISVLL